jgi:hypothetical protein
LFTLLAPATVSPRLFRDELFKRFRGLETVECPFVNLPEAKERTMGERLDRGEK